MNEVLLMKLQTLSAKSSCIRLIFEWANEYLNLPNIDALKDENSYGTCSVHDCFIWQMYEMEVPKAMVIPSLIRDQIEDNITPILDQVKGWIQYHHRKNFFHDEPSSPLSEYLAKFIWQPNLTIDYAATAKNISTDADFNSMERFRFACTYCFVEEITNLRDMADIAIEWSFETEPLLVYWSKYLANELGTITLPAYASIDVIMFDKAVREYDLWRPIEYFFAKLNSAHKIWQFSSVIEHRGRNYQKQLLAKLNDEEKYLVCQDAVTKMVKNYADSDDFEEICQLCRRCEGKLNTKILAGIVEELVPLSMKNHENSDELTRLLVEIWADASEKDKKSLIESGLRTRVADKCTQVMADDEKYDFSSRGRYNEPMRFIRVFASTDNPKSFFSFSFHWLVIWQPLASVVELMNECQLELSDVESIKKELRRSPKMDEICLKFLRFGKFDEFNQLISFCCSDHDANIVAYKTDLMRSEEGLTALSVLLNRSDWRCIYEFVNNVFQHGDIAARLTASLMQYAFRKHYIKERLRQDDVNGIKDCICSFMLDADSLALAKEKCVDYLFHYLEDDENFVFKPTQFQDILAWCYGSDDQIVHFKATLEIYRAFDTQLKSCVDEYAFRASESMEDLLHWYFLTDCERRGFKLEIICSYREYKTVADLLKQRKYRRCMLNWFFESNVSQIAEFKANFLA